MKIWSPYEKYRQVRKEAGATGGLLVLLILFWCFAGFGLAGVDAEIFGLPLWAVMGSVGVWIFAIVGVVATIIIFAVFGSAIMSAYGSMF